jgi:hypothetical protein
MFPDLKYFFAGKLFSRIIEKKKERKNKSIVFDISLSKGHSKEE